jgi:hypothetical protein
MTDNDKKYGRTLFDLIAEHPKKTFFIFLFILLIAIVLIIFRIPLKLGSVEIGSDYKIIHDTFIRSKIDTQYYSKPNNFVSRLSPSYANEENSKKALVKKADTLITVDNLPANINTGVNNGIIGNNNDVKVNVNEIQRKLDEPSKQRLLELIHQTSESNKKGTTPCIRVSAVGGNSEALNFAVAIFQFLKEQKLNLQDDIGSFQRSPIIKGVLIEPGQECISVSVGYLP